MISTISPAYVLVSMMDCFLPLRSVWQIALSDLAVKRTFTLTGKPYISHLLAQLWILYLFSVIFEAPSAVMGLQMIKP